MHVNLFIRGQAVNENVQKCTNNVYRVAQKVSRHKESSLDRI